MKRLLPFLTWALAAPLFTNAQCDAGEVEIQMNLVTDPWGYELYWEIVESGNACGDGTIIWGGNDIEVGCDGGGQQDATGGGYASNSYIELDPFCLTEGVTYDLIFVDDWGDGGLTFEVFQDGVLANLFVGGGSGSTWTFTAGEINLPANDSPCGAEEVIVDGDPLYTNNEGAVAQIGEITPGGGNCAVYGVWCEGGVSNSVWAKFTAPDDGVYFVSTCNEGTTCDTQVAVYAYDDCGDQDTYTLMTSNDDILGGCGLGNYWASGCYVSCLEADAEYLIQIDGWNGSAGDIVLTVSSWEGDSQLQVAFGDIPCALDKGEPGNGFILPYVIGWGVNFEANWTGPNGYSAETAFIYDLEPGTYSFTGTNACTGEVLQGEWTINDPQPYIVQFDVLDPECPESFDGSIEVNIGGATSPYNITWTNAEGIIGDQFILEGLDDGDYACLIEDANGCTYEQNLTLVAEDDIDFSLGSDTTICETAEVLLYGPPGYNYEWQDGSINQFFQVNAEEYGLGTFSFILHLTNNEGCSATDAIVVTIDNCNSVEAFTQAGFSLFPNPNQGQFRVDGLPADEVGAWRIIDMTGKEVSGNVFNNVQGGQLLINVDTAPGMYFFQVLSGDKWYSTPIIME